MLHKRLRQARLKIDITQETVAKRAGMQLSQYNRYENGRHRPLPETLEKLAIALEVSADELLDRGE